MEELVLGRAIAGCGDFFRTNDETQVDVTVAGEQTSAFTTVLSMILHDGNTLDTMCKSALVDIKC